MSSRITRMVPASIKRRVVESTYYRKKTAAELATSSKRLDLCAAQIAHVLHLSGSPSLQGKVCLEVGSGWVLSHALVFHLLGAKRVIATDLTRLAQPASLSLAIHKAIPSIVRDLLSPFCEHSELRARLDNLLSIDKFSFDVLNGLGIEYKAPVDLAKERLNIPLDFVYSASVLEYVPAGDIPNLLDNLTKDLRKDGIMVHCIHLEDHSGMSDNTFDFYSKTKEDYLKGASAWRVNRIRSSQWRRLFHDAKDLDCRLIYQWSRRDQSLPALIDPSIAHEGEEDLRTTHIGVMCVRK